MHHGYSANVVLDHYSYRFKHGMAQFCLKCVLVLDQVADTHLSPHGGVHRGSEVVQEVQRAQSICRKGTGEKEKEKKMG